MGAESIYADLEIPPAQEERGRHRARPYVIINMVASLDGKTTSQGRAARIGSRTDRQLMRTLRSKADAVMVGANTLRAEKLSLGLDERFPGGPQPLAIVVSKTGADVPLEENLIPNEGQSVLMIVAADAPADAPDGAADQPLLLQPARRGERLLLRAPATTPSGDVDLGEALKTLKAKHAVDSLLVEGGPSLNHSLISQDLADELFLTLAPKLLGGAPPEALTLLEGHELVPPTRSPDPQLLSAHLSGNELYLRYRFPRPSTTRR